MLTAKRVAGLLATGRYLDKDGLSLHVRGPERRYWTFRYQWQGRERVMTFGSADKVSLALAREKAAAARDTVRQGRDPMAEKQTAKQRARAARAEAANVVTFGEAVDRYIAAREAGWRGRRSTHDWRRCLVTYAVPVFGKKAVNEITVENVLKVMQPIWTKKPVTARRVRNRIELVLNFAKAHGWRSGENPAQWRGNLDMLLPTTLHEIVPRAALPWRQMPAFMASLREHDSMGAKALQFVILTACRSGEARGATWDEIDLDQEVWVIPGRRTKTGKGHRVPLSEAAMAILRGLHAVRTNAPLVFLGRYTGNRMCEITLSAIVRRLGYDVTVHGFRSTFRDWAAETGKPADTAEMALAHTVGSAVARAYQRSDLLDARRVLMSQWSDFLTQPPAQVVPLRRA